MDNSCERCSKRPRREGERFCGLCRNILLREMKETGYLTRVPRLPWASGEELSDLISDRPTLEPLTVEELVDAFDKGQS